MSGPKPIPNEKARLLGNAGHKKLPAVQSVTSLAPADSSVVPLSIRTDEARKIWRAVVDLPWVGRSDTLLLEHLCALEDRRQDFLTRLDESGPTFITEKGYVGLHPLVSEVRKLDEEKRKLFSMLGLSPADRTQLGLAEVKAQSKLEQMMARKRASAS